METRLIAYLADLLGESVVLESLTVSERKRAVWLVNFYTLKTVIIRGARHVLAFAKPGLRYTPVAVAKQMAIGNGAIGLPFVYVPREFGPHDIKRLIAAGVSYVMPGCSLHLPDCGLSVSKNVRPSVVRERFSVSAQMLVIGYILKKWDGEITLADGMKRTGFSAASIVYAFREIEHFGAGEKVRTGDGRTTMLKLASAKDIWEKCASRFFNPCKRTVGVIEKPEGAVMAGVDALARISSLNEDEPSCFALPMKGYKALGVEELSADSAPCQLQLWHYRPTAICNDSVDPVSLFLTLQNESDDRVQIELEKLQEVFKW